MFDSYYLNPVLDRINLIQAFGGTIKKANFCVPQNIQQYKISILYTDIQCLEKILKAYIEKKIRLADKKLKKVTELPRLTLLHSA